MTDGTGTTTYTYDEANRLILVTTPGPTTVGYRYDRDGNRTRLIYPDATAVTYSFDKAGRLGSLADWASRTTSYGYLPDGLVGTLTNANATAAAYTYDNARRLTQLNHTTPGGAALDTLTYALDAAGNVTGLTSPSAGPTSAFARPDGLAGSNGTWTGTFAAIDETTPSDADFIASPSGPTSSTYYEVTLSDVTPPAELSSITVRYRYAKSGNDNGQTINLTVELRQGTTVIAGQTQPNIPGASGTGWQAGSFTLSAAQRAAITSYADLRLRFAPVGTGGGQARSGQVSWAEVEVAGFAITGDTATYTYDRLSRLTTVGGTTSRSYTYDPAGNRLTRVAGSTTTSSTYDRADRITAAGATSITVNAVGATTARGSDTFTYDGANRLTSATVSGTTETYTYDGDGVRFTRQVGSGPVTRYVSDPNRDLPVTISEGTRKYVWGLGLAYAVTGSATETYHADRLGSTREITDGSGALVMATRSDEFRQPDGQHRQLQPAVRLHRRATGWYRAHLPAGPLLRSEPGPVHEPRHVGRDDRGADQPEPLRLRR